MQNYRSGPHNIRRRSAPETQWDPYQSESQFSQDMFSMTLIEAPCPLTDEFDPFCRPQQKSFQESTFPRLKETGSSSTFYNTSESLNQTQFFPSTDASFFPTDPLSQGSFYNSNDPASPQEESFDPPISYPSQSNQRGFSSVLYNSDQLLSKSTYINDISKGLGAVSFDANNSFESLPYSSSFPFTTPTINGVDQNPPCNTLYVGNLPNETTEEELFSLFCKCSGYKRLSLKMRHTGPMCFVEVTGY